MIFSHAGRRATVAFLLSIVGWCLASAANGVTWQVDEGASTFAVLTHKAGVAARLAHDHVVTAQGSTGTLTLDPAAPTEATFTFEAEAEALTVDDPEQQQALEPFLRQLGLVDASFEALKDKSLGKIRKAMLGPEQLDAARHPTIAARTVAVVAEPGVRGEIDFAYRVTLAVTIRGTTVEAPVAARFSIEEGTGLLSVDAVGDFRFSDFGITPYRAMLGAVRNDDAFQIVVRLKARRD